MINPICTQVLRHHSLLFPPFPGHPALSLCLCVSVSVSLSFSDIPNLNLKYLFKFNIISIPAKVHRSRFKVYNVDELKCPLCLSAVDNKVHFAVCSPAFDDLRYELIDPKYFNNPCEFRLALLLATQKEHALKNLALCVKKAFSKRKILLLRRT